MAVPVLDASALLAYLRGEPGDDVATEAIANGAAISTVNLAESLSRSTDNGLDPRQLAEELRGSGLLDGAITVHPFTAADAIEAARLRPLTRAAGLSLGDRACLALTRRLGGVALTTAHAHRLGASGPRRSTRSQPAAANSIAKLDSAQFHRL